MAKLKSTAGSHSSAEISVRVLLIDDEAESLLPVLAQNVGPLGFELTSEADSGRALDVIAAQGPELVLLDLHFPGDDLRPDNRTTGGELLTRIRRQFPELAVVVFTSRLEDSDIPVEEFDAQPHAQVGKPNFRQVGWASELADRLRDALRYAKLMEESNGLDLGFHVGITERMRQVEARARVAATNKLNVLIFGETGTGKDLLAKAIHRLSGRKGRFEHVNCSGMHEESLEAQLFGHERGAYTGASAARAGLFELADGGTLFLDEIQSMPMSLQNRLMLVLETGRIRRMGANDDRVVDVRIIVATNHSLSDLVADGVLRQDLAHRFTVFPINLPPLRDRLDDLPALFELLLEKANSSCGRNVRKTLRPETLNKLKSHGWPGNIRELENTITRGVALTRASILLPQDIEFDEISSRRTEPTYIRSDEVNQPVELSATTKEDVSPTEIDQMVSVLTNQLVSLPVDERYPFLLDQGQQFQIQILTEFVCRLQRKTGKKITHKFLAAELDPLKNGQSDFDKVRQFVCSRIKLTQLECNQ